MRRHAEALSTRTWGRASALLTAALVSLAAAAQLVAPLAAGQRTAETVASRASAARNAGRLEEAVALYKEGVAARPDWAEGLWFLGASLYELTRYSEAREAFTRLLRQQPDHAGAFGMRGICAFHLQDHENALRDLLRSRALGIAQTPSVGATVRYHLGILLTRFGDFEVGHAVLSEFAPEGNESPQVIEALGLNLLRKPILPAEIAAADRPVVELAGRAAFAMAARRSAAAQQALDELVTRHPEMANVHYARGVFLLAEAPDRAIADFRRELAISPAHVSARLQLAFEFLRRGENEAARPLAEEAARLQPHYFTTHLALGQVLFESGELLAAVAEFELAVKLAPESAQAHFVLSRAYARAGRTADAERAREEFVRLDQLAREQRVAPHSAEEPVEPAPAK